MRASLSGPGGSAGRCLLHSEPKDAGYHKKLVVDFGIDVDLTDTSVDLVLKTDAFPRD
ncbi:hypothetical protein ACFWEB_25585 [Streptomyces parvus]|uniref:hypothetical protein n=1 Tax=Streptomyces parvus TaxID=66428 RepID=UPI0036527BF4